MEEKRERLRDTEKKLQKESGRQTETKRVKGKRD